MLELIFASAGSWKLYYGVLTSIGTRSLYQKPLPGARSSACFPVSQLVSQLVQSMVPKILSGSVNLSPSLSLACSDNCKLHSHSQENQVSVEKNLGSTASLPPSWVACLLAARQSLCSLLGAPNEQENKESEYPQK